MYKFILNKAVSKLIIKFDFGAVLFVIQDILKPILT